MSVVLNGHTYSESDFVNYGHNQVFPATGLKLFPDSIFTDMLAELAAASALQSISPSTSGNMLISNGTSWVRSIDNPTVIGRVGGLQLHPGATNGGQLTWYRDNISSWLMYMLTGGGTLLVRDIVNARTFASFNPGSSSTANLSLNSHFIFETDNTHDIGASGANRPRVLYLSSNAIVGQGANVQWAGRTRINSQADGRVTFEDSTGATFSRMSLGPETTSFPAFRRSGNGIELVDGANTQFTNFRALTLTGSTFIANSSDVTNAGTQAAMTYVSGGMLLWSFGAAGATRGTWTVRQRAPDGSLSVDSLALDTNGDLTIAGNVYLNVNGKSLRVSGGAGSKIAIGLDNADFPALPSGYIGMGQNSYLAAGLGAGTYKEIIGYDSSTGAILIDVGVTTGGVRVNNTLTPHTDSAIDDGTYTRRWRTVTAKQFRTGSSANVGNTSVITLDSAPSGGLLHVYCTDDDGTQALFMVRIGAPAIHMLANPFDATFSGTKDTASKVNVYVESGVIKLQNNVGITRSFAWWKSG